MYVIYVNTKIKRLDGILLIREIGFPFLLPDSGSTFRGLFYSEILNIGRCKLFFSSFIPKAFELHLQMFANSYKANCLQ